MLSGGSTKHTHEAKISLFSFSHLFFLVHNLIFLSEFFQFSKEKHLNISVCGLEWEE